MAATSSLEKIFFALILENPKYFDKVATHYFDNEHIQYVYSVVKKHVKSLNNRIIPSPQKIVELVRLEDRDKSKISNELLKQILTTDVGKYQQSTDDVWLDHTFKAWLIEKGIRDRVVQSIDKIRELDAHTLNHEKALEVFQEVKNIVGDTSLIDYDDDDLGSDFDDPDSHEQNTNANKLGSGWTALNDILEGGWDRKTLNIFMAPSGVGKSLWLGNVAVNIANVGKNIAYISLEMSEKKIMKRLGSSRLKIPIHDYDQLSRDSNFIKQKLAEMHHGYAKGSDMFENKIGKIFAKEYPAGTATVYDVDNYIKKLEEIKGIKIDVLIVDYLTIMDPNTKNGSLYTNGKALAEGIRAIAQKNNLVAFTAMQVAKDAFDATDIGAKDISESKAILETADTLFGIIQNGQMKKEGVFYLKLIKLRDGEFKWSKWRFLFDKQFMTINEDSIVE